MRESGVSIKIARERESSIKSDLNSPFLFVLCTISRSSQCSTTGATKAGMYYPVWDSAYKRILAANRKE